MPLLTLLTDFGLTDYYVGAVKGVILGLAPGAQLVDLGHDVPPGDVAAAAFVLAAAAPAFPAGTVHLAVVDPGVGSRRRILVATTAGALFVAPDNGLLTGLLTPVLTGTSAETATVRSVERTDLFRRAPGNTFHGRDRFAPVAAWLLRGGDPADLGPVVTDPVLLPGKPPRRLADDPEGRHLEGRIVYVDRFGNLVTDVPSAWLDGKKFESAVVETPEGERRADLLVDHYGQIPAERAAVLPGSTGTLELSLNGASLAERWQNARGARIRLFLS